MRTPARFLAAATAVVAVVACVVVALDTPERSVLDSPLAMQTPQR